MHICLRSTRPAAITRKRLCLVPVYLVLPFQASVRQLHEVDLLGLSAPRLPARPGLQCLVSSSNAWWGAVVEQWGWFMIPGQVAALCSPVPWIKCRHIKDMGKKAHHGGGSSSAAGSAAPPARDVAALLTEAERQLTEEEVLALLAGFVSSAKSEHSLSAPLQAAIPRMQEHVANMNATLAARNNEGIKRMRQNSFRRDGSGDPTENALTLLQTATTTSSEIQKAFVACLNIMTEAVIVSVERAAHQNFVVMKANTTRCSGLETANAELKNQVVELAGEVGELRASVAEIKERLDEFVLRFGRARDAVPMVPEERARGRAVRRPSSPSPSASRLRSASRASSCGGSVSSNLSHLSRISKAQQEAGSRRPSMGPCVQFDGCGPVAAPADPLLPMMFPGSVQYMPLPQSLPLLQPMFPQQLSPQQAPQLMFPQQAFQQQQMWPAAYQFMPPYLPGVSPEEEPGSGSVCSGAAMM